MSDKLNEEQILAINQTGDVFLNAGPGSGKTRVIIERIINSIKNGTDPKKIIAITFTNKAANVMTDRLASRGITDVWCTTFHKLAVRILRDIGVKFSIYDADDANVILKKVIREYSPGLLQYIKEVRSYIDNRVDSIFTIPVRPMYISVENAYHTRMKDLLAVDFSTLILQAVRHIEDSLKRTCAAQKWEHILVDEAQDTSVSQFQLIKQLKLDRPCVFMVGDLDQNIYTWRGAHPDNIQSFISEFHPTIINMGRNYRSGKSIITHSSRLIDFNDNRIKKDLVSEREHVSYIDVIKYRDSIIEAEAIAKICQRSLKVGNVAILYRTNFISGQLELELKKLRIKYGVRDSISFFRRREIKDMLSVFRSITNPYDTLSFTTTLKALRVGLGAKFLKLFPNLYTFLYYAGRKEKLNAREMELYFFFQGLLEQLTKTFDAQTLDWLLKRSEYFGHYSDENRVKNMTHLAGLMVNKNIEDFLYESALDSDDNEDSIVTLMTMHSAKGTEYKTVIICGCEEQLIPHVNNPNIEEERRLFYVSMTRAEDNLYMTYVSRRNMYGRFVDMVPSRFLTEAGFSV